MTYWVLKILLTPIMLLVWRVRVEGRRHVPTRGPVILAPNHVAFLDSFFLPLVLRRRVTFVAKAEYFDSWRTRWFFKAAGQIPMRREGGSASERALAAARQVLAAGRVLGIYPEGTRSPDGRLYRGHTGVARLALGTGVPVVPVGLVGTADVQPVGTNKVRPFRTVTVRFGEPLDLTRFRRDQVDDPLVLRAITDELMFRIRELTGQSYVDRYAKKHGAVGAAPVATVAPATVDTAALGPSGDGARQVLAPRTTPGTASTAQPGTPAPSTPPAA